MNKKHIETQERARLVRELMARQRDPEFIRRRRHELKLADILAVGATTAGVVAALSSAALEIPLLMGVGAFLAGFGAVGAVRKLRILSDLTPKGPPSTERRSGEERRKEEPTYAEAR